MIRTRISEIKGTFLTWTFFFFFFFIYIIVNKYIKKNPVPNFLKKCLFADSKPTKPKNIEKPNWLSPAADLITVENLPQTTLNSPLPIHYNLEP